MTRRELAARIAKKTGHSAALVGAILEATRDALVDQLAAGGRLEWRGLGTFTVKHYAARELHNPATGKTIKLPARAGVAFKPAKKLLAPLAPPKRTRRPGSPTAAPRSNRG